MMEWLLAAAGVRSLEPLEGAGGPLTNRKFYAMKTLVHIAVVTGILFTAATTSPGAAQSSNPSSANSTQSGAYPGLMLRGSDVLNAKVFSQQGEELGHIRDFLLDPKTGDITYAVLGSGGWQGFGEKYALVPWPLIKQDEQRAENYILQADREKIRTAPTFERDHWATVLQPGYLAKVQEHFSAASQPQQASQTPAAQPSPPATGTAQQTPPQQQQQQAQQRSRKETQSTAQKQRQSSKSGGTVGTEDGAK